MPISQEEKANSFAALHRSAKAFVIPNPWDVASARALAGLGFQALATSSGASAAVLGRRDGEISRDEAIAHARAIAAATDLPVSADLEKGFGDSPQSAAETIRLAAAAGVVGGSIEDATQDKSKPLFDIGFATERVAAAVAAARALPFTFTLTARSENFLRGNPEGLRLVRKSAWQVREFDLFAAYGVVRARTQPAMHVVHARSVMTLDEAIERVSKMIGMALDWTFLESFLPKTDDAQFRRSALASSFLAALELARRGRLELSQDEPFAPIRLKRAA